MWAGHEAYIEIADGASVRHEGQAIPNPGEGFVAIDEVWSSDIPSPPERPGAFAAEMLEGKPTPEALAGRFEKAVEGALDRWRAGTLGGDPRDAASAPCWPGSSIGG